MPVAQINVARFRLPKDDPANAAFMGALDHVITRSTRDFPANMPDIRVPHTL